MSSPVGTSVRRLLWAADPFSAVTTFEYAVELLQNRDPSARALLHRAAALTSDPQVLTLTQQLTDAYYKRTNSTQVWPRAGLEITPKLSYIENKKVLRVEIASATQLPKDTRLHLELDGAFYQHEPTCRTTDIAIKTPWSIARVAIEHNGMIGLTKKMINGSMNRVVPKRFTPPANPKKKETVQIIIPVFDDLKSLRRCIDALVRAKNTSEWELTLVNDKTPHEDIEEYLEACVRQHGATLLERPINGGFAAAVNVALRTLGTRNDVVILNSDVRVSDFWLDRLLEAKRQHPSAGAICPISNNAELFSVPQAMKNNAAPDDDLLGFINTEIAKGRKLTQCKEAPSLVGACCLITQEALKKVGLFDESITDQGYGEDTEYAIQIQAAGLKNLVAQNVYVAHEGSKSFKSAKRLLALKNNQKLSALYPEHFLEYQSFLRQENLSEISEHIQRAVLESGRISLCRFLELTPAQWDAVTTVSDIPTLALIKDPSPYIGSKHTTFWLKGHKIPGLNEIKYELPCDHRLFNVHLSVLKTSHGQAVAPIFDRTQGNTDGVLIQTSSDVHFLVPYLKTLESGFTRLKNIAQEIDNRDLNARVTVLGETFNDPALARLNCVTLAGEVKTEQMPEFISELGCDAVLDCSDNLRFLMVEVAKTIKLPLVSHTEAVRLLGRGD